MDLGEPCPTGASGEVVGCRRCRHKGPTREPGIQPSQPRRDPRAGREPKEVVWVLPTIDLDYDEPAAGAQNPRTLDQPTFKVWPVLDRTGGHDSIE